MYQYSTCDPARNVKATLPNLVNHVNITRYVDLWIPQIKAASAAGGEFFVGEYNSVSCSGACALSRSEDRGGVADGD